MSGRMWGGRFEGKLDPRVDRLNRSFAFDRRLFGEDIDGSVAWARALRRAGLLTTSELTRITAGLERVRREFAQGRFSVEATDEDIHTAVERRLSELAGAAGGKLHTGRSRNDQVACDLHLWLKKACDAACAAAAGVARAIVGLAERAGAAAVPAYTHGQRAQPVLFAHHLLAYAEMLERDRARLLGARTRADVLPLGSGAAVGSGVAVDRRALAKSLGFARISSNSLDAVGSRDAALEYLAAASLLGLTFSRLGAELVAWTSSEFGFLKLGDRASTGSSLLPQKRNPDAAELARGKAGLLLGRFVALATALKGLPLAYNKDLQEDKEACFDAADTIDAVAGGLAATLGACRVVPEACARALQGGHMLAVELADYLVRKGLPFRRAHATVGGLVREAEKAGVDVTALPLARLRAAAREFGPDVARHLTLAAALGSKRARGGTSPAQVRRELAAWKRRLASRK